MVQAIPDNYPQLAPYLSVAGAAEAIDWYVKVFDAKERGRMAGPDGKIGHAELEFGRGLLMLADEYPEMNIVGPKTIGGTGMTLNFYCEDVDAVYKTAIDNGAESLREPTDEFYGDRSAQFLDPYGHRWNVSTHVEDVSPEEMERRAKEAMAGG